MPTAFADIVSRRAEELGLAIPADAVKKLETYYGLLIRWNRTTNLTALPVETLSPPSLDRILFEPLSAAPDFPLEPVCWIDLGSGGGSPAVPLRTVRPTAKLTMVEVRTRKAAFLREVVRALVLENVTVAACRFEELATDPQFAAQAEVVTARAVRADQAFVDTVLRLLRPKGLLLLFESITAGTLADPQLALASRRSLLTGSTAQLSSYRRL